MKVGYDAFYLDINTFPVWPTWSECGHACTVSEKSETHYRTVQRTDMDFIAIVP